MPELSDKLLEKIEIARLPSLPQVLVRLLEACEQEDVSFAQLSEIIGTDAGLSARMLAVGNSPLYRHQTSRLTSLEQLLVRLGINTIKSIAITTAVRQFFARFKGQKTVGYPRFWQHSLAAGIIARLLAELTSYRSPDEAYLAGLLHDIGQLVLGSCAPAEYSAIRLQADSDAALIALETEHFGNPHPEIGAWLIDGWNLDSFMADAVLYHHATLETVTDGHPLVKIVYLANLLATRTTQSGPDRYESADRLLGLTRGVVQDLVKRAQQRLAEIAQSISVELDLADAAPDWTEEPVSSVWDQAQLELAGKVEENALVDGVRGVIRGAAGEEGVLLALQQSAGILFDVRHVLFFLHQESDGTLLGRSPMEPGSLVGELAVPLQAGRSLIADAWLGAGPTDTGGSEDELSVLDRQVLRLLGSEAMVCLPMLTGEGKLGTMILGVEATQLQALRTQQALGLLFAREAATALDEQRTRQQREGRMLNDTLAEVDSKVHQVVHEVSTPLGVLRNYLSILAKKIESSDPAQEDLRIMREEIGRVGDIVRRLTDVSDVREGPGPVDVNALVRDLAAVFRDTLFAPNKVESQIELDESLPPIMTNRNSLKQILINITKNAVEAMPEGGRLSIQTQDYVHMGKNEYVEIVLSDSGPGIPPHILAQLFEPVESTKGKGHSGLGLSIVRNLVAELNGVITCSSSEGKGTSFRVMLPRELGA
ncbi:MAG: HDOD domain-containing protein [Chromatiales bacterium]|jgi:HD-like signal output (HDOD) protein/signal transduction histidine kinase